MMTTIDTNKKKIDEKILEIQQALISSTLPPSFLEVLRSTLARIDKKTGKSPEVERARILFNIHNIISITEDLKADSGDYVLFNSLFRSLQKLLPEDKTSEVKSDIDLDQYLLCEEVQVLAEAWGGTYLADISQILGKIKIGDETNALREALALVILRIHLSNTGLEKNREMLLVFLKRLMDAVFKPALEFKSSRLRLSSHRYDAEADVSTKDLEIKNISLNEINPLYDLAFAELVENFDFYINVFNLDYPDAFQQWAKNTSSALQRKVAIFSESLRIAILLDSCEAFESLNSDEAANKIYEKIMEFYEAFYLAAHTNNPELIFSDVLHNLLPGQVPFEHCHATLKENFAMNFAIALTKNVYKDEIIKHWRMDLQKKFEKYFHSIKQVLRTHFDLFQAVLMRPSEFVQWLEEDVKREDLLSPLWLVFHGKEISLKIDERKPFLEKFNAEKAMEFSVVLKNWMEKKDDKLLRGALYLGKGRFTYIHWQLVDALFVLTSKNNESILSTWKKIDPKPSSGPALFSPKLVGDAPTAEAEHCRPGS